MKNLPLFLLLLVSVVSFAQIGIGTTAPNSSAALDVTSTTKGFLPPRMTTVQRDAIVSPATGIQIYNTTTNTNDYFNGAAWISGSAGAQVTAATDPTFTNASNQAVSADWVRGVTTPTYGSAVLDTGTNVNLPPLADASTAVNVLNFTLPSAGTWDVTVQMRAAITSYTQDVYWCLCVYDNNNTLVPNSETFFNSTPATVGIGLNSTGQTRVIVTTTGAASYSLRGYQPGGTANIYATSDGVGRTKATWVKIQ